MVDDENDDGSGVDGYGCSSTGRSQCTVPHQYWRFLKQQDVQGKKKEAENRPAAVTSAGGIYLVEVYANGS